MPFSKYDDDEEEETFPYTMSVHAQDKAHELNVPLYKIMNVVLHGRSQPVTMYPNQTRYIGQGIAVCVDEVTKTVITLYLDKVLTPLRPDQIAKGVTINRKTK